MMAPKIEEKAIGRTVKGTRRMLKRERAVKALAAVKDDSESITEINKKETRVTIVGAAATNASFTADIDIIFLSPFNSSTLLSFIFSANLPSHPYCFRFLFASFSL